MPADLRFGRIPLPGPTDDGRPLDRLRAPHSIGTPAHDHDLAITRAVVAQRSHVGDEWARALDRHGATTAWRELAERVTTEPPAVVQALLGSALAAASTQAGVGKRRWQRQRPFQVDPSITVVGRTPRPGDSSYPSAHSARAYAAARLLGRLDPALQADAWALAREVALSRVYAGVHFASDVVAGARLGVSLADSVLARRDEIIAQATPAA